MSSSHSLVMTLCAAVLLPLLISYVHSDITPFTIGAVFDASIYDNMSKTFLNSLARYRSGIAVDGFTLSSRGNLYEFLNDMCISFETGNVEVMLVVGSESLINSVNMVAANMGISVIGYTTNRSSSNLPKKVYNPLYMRLEPTKRHVAKGLIMMLESNGWFEFSVIVDRDLMDDGFFTELEFLTSARRWSIESIVFLSRNSDTATVNYELSLLRNDRSKLIVLHAETELAGLIFRSPQMRFLEDLRFLWIFTEQAVTYQKSDLKFYPGQSLSLDLQENKNVSNIIDDVISFIFTSLNRTFGHVLVQEKRMCNGTVSRRRKRLSEILYRSLTSSKLTCDWGVLTFDRNGNVEITDIDIKFLVKDNVYKSPYWHKVGNIRTDFVQLSTIKGPGETFIRPFFTKRMRYRVVTNPVKPFVMVQMPHRDYNRCIDAHPCLVIPRKSKELTISIIDNYVRKIGQNASVPYNISCCRGLSINLLQELSEDLKFDYVLYLVADKTYGVKDNNGTWNGIIGDLIDGTAHIAVAAMSITRARSRVIDFTYPYFFSRFSMLLSDKKQSASFMAFLEPFSTAVWCGIFLSGVVTSISIAVFEWNSPFGLNPWGRKRKTNYSLGSGMTMVLSILFGHTVKTKSPKAWPSKVMQNFWAPACIFILASYTANMASFIAGKTFGQKYNDIHDPKLLDLRLGILKGSAVESLLSRINTRIYHVARQRYVRSSDAGIADVINGTLDGYLGDHPILDYARAKLDPRCELKLMKQTFGEDAYGIGVAKGSPLTKIFSEKIKEYSQSNVLKNLENLHFSDPQCYPERRTQQESQLEVSHHAGLFIMLAAAFGVSMFVLFFEHCVFRWCVPRLRHRANSSCWKSTHMMFFSQRLHRIITSAELVSPHDSAREILRIMRNREFSRFFQKSTIRKNRLAVIAKTKRLNRNFFDVVEKAKMQDVRDKSFEEDEDEPIDLSMPIAQPDMQLIGPEFEMYDSRCYSSKYETRDLPIMLDRTPRLCVQYEWPERQDDWLLNDDVIDDDEMCQRQDRNCDYSGNYCLPHAADDDFSTNSFAHTPFTSINSKTPNGSLYKNHISASDNDATVVIDKENEEFVNNKLKVSLSNPQCFIENNVKKVKGTKRNKSCPIKLQPQYQFQSTNKSLSECTGPPLNIEREDNKVYLTLSQTLHNKKFSTKQKDTEV